MEMSPFYNSVKGSEWNVSTTIDKEQRTKLLFWQQTAFEPQALPTPMTVIGLQLSPLYAPTKDEKLHGDD